MTADRDDDAFLEELAAAILDGRTPPVPRTEEQTDRQAALRQAEILTRIVGVHQHLQTDEPAAGTGEEQSVGPLSWGRLALLQEIGRGAFGVVYRARDPRLDREVALKLLWPSGADADRFIESMVEEGRLLARIHHPNVVTIYDANVIDGRVGLTMELVRGQTLAEAFEANGPFAPEDVRRVGIEVARALAAVHEAGLLHRDVKAQNVMRRSDGRLVVMDFGAGRRTHADSGEDAAITGTPLYVAPEVLDQQRATVQSDIYSLGVLLFYLLTGDYPVRGRTIRELRAAHREGQLKSLSVLRPDVSSPLAGVVERALSAAPSDRYASAAELADALSSLDTTPETTVWSRAKAASMVALLLLAAAGVWTTMRQRTAVPVISRSSDVTEPAPRPQAGAVADAEKRNLAQSPPAVVETGAVSSEPQVIRKDDLTIRKVSPPDPYLFGKLSRDGKYVLYSDQGGSRLMVHDLTTGEQRPLIVNAGDGRGAIEYAVISRDGTQVAYSWETTAARELRVADARDSGAASQVILRDANVAAPQALAVMMPVDWVPDGSAVLVLRSRNDGTHDIALVATRDGAVRTLKQGLPWMAAMQLSHDGQHIAFDHPVAEDNDARDISILSTQTGEQTPLVRAPGQDAFPLWAPDDNGVLFASDRSGALGLWMAPVVSGRPDGRPRVIRKDMGRIQPISLAADGTLFYSLQSGAVDVYTAALNADGTVAADSVAPAALSYLGSNLDPEWSEDGRALAFVSRRRSIGPRAQALVIVRDNGAQEDVVWPDLQGFTEPRWSPDQRLFLVRGGDRNGMRGPWLIDAATGAVVSRLGGPGFPDMEWSRDGTLFAIAQGGVIKFDQASQSMQDIHRDPRGRTVVELAVSPDERWLAITVADKGARSIDIIPAGGGIAREILSLAAPEAFLLQEWAHDGASVLFSRGRVESGFIRGDWSLWSVPTAGGPPRALNLKGNGLRGVKISPDGTRIAYRTGEPGWDYWIMRNFLAPEGSVR